MLERAPALEEVGAGLQLSPNAVKPLLALGLGEALARAGREPAVMEMRMGLSGRRVFSLEQARAMRRRYGAPYLLLHRADLVGLLAAALEGRAPGALRLGTEVLSHDGAAARMATGEVVAGDLVVGADGLHSVIRTAMLGPERPTFTGNVAYRCLAPAGPDLPDGPCIWAGPRAHGVTYPLRGGEVVNFVGIVEEDEIAEETWSAETSREETLARFAGWDARLQRLIETAPRHLKWGLYTRPPLPRWAEGPVALLGDAAHPMLPSLAQGAGMAIEDAWVLAGLCDAQPMTAALARYEAARKPRASRVQAVAARNVRLFHHRGLLGKAFAYGPIMAAGLAAPSVIRARQDWVYREDVTEMDFGV